jgi:hypothetical protein
MWWGKVKVGCGQENYINTGVGLVWWGKVRAMCEQDNYIKIGVGLVLD